MGKPVLTREGLIAEWRENRAAYLLIHPEDNFFLKKKSDTSDLVEKFPQGREEREEVLEPENFNKKKLAADYISDDYRRFLGRFRPVEDEPLSAKEEIAEVTGLSARRVNEIGGNENIFKIANSIEEEESTHLTEFYNDGENEHVVISYPGSSKRDMCTSTIQPIPRI